MGKFFILMFCWICWGFGDCQQPPRAQCLDTQFQCDPHPRSTAPRPNEFAEYITRIIRSPGQLPVCTFLNPDIRPEFEIIRPIDNLNQPNFLLLQSPNFGPGQNYRNRRLVSYNVQCPTGRLPFLVFNAINIQPAECFDFCEDFITVTPNCTNFGVDVNGCGSSTSCGTRPENDNFNLNSELFTVTFRTSAFDGFPGFQLSVICFEPEPLDSGGARKKRNERTKSYSEELWWRILWQRKIGRRPSYDSVPQPVNITLTPLEQQIIRNLTAEFFELIPTCVSSDVNATSRPVGTSALHLSLTFENSSNPVIRTAVETTLSIAERQDSARVAEERIRLRDRCRSNNGDCEQNCIETEFAIQCTCITGYALNADEKSCYEINECLENNGGCEQICTNTPGSRQCSCRPGFVLAANGMTCTVGLSVSITVDYARPADFFPDDNEYRAASGPVNVTCIATGPGTGAVSYQWSSTCRNCPFRTAASSVIRRAAVHSGDNGTHTCVATKDGNTVRASIDFLIVDAGIQVFRGSPRGNFPPDNGLVISDNPVGNDFRFRIVCRSDSMSGNVGQFIGLDGNSTLANNSFFAIARPQPGELLIQNRVGAQNALTSGQQGVYTCRIPLQSGEIRTFNIGVYPSGFATPPRIVDLISEYSASSSNLTCTTTGSPATSVTWTMNDQPLTIDGRTYDMVQTVINRSASTYDNVLIINKPMASIQDNTFTCTVANTLGSDTSSLQITDINECLTNNGGCDQICINTQGSRVCRCWRGYRASGTRCIDIDGCQKNNGGCDQICANTQRSRVCRCRRGYRTSGTRCIDINECQRNNGGCGQICTNTQGSRVCSCRSGYRASSTRCIDVNECSTNNGGCAHICTNTTGSRRCSCRSGFRLSSNGRSCFRDGSPGTGPVRR